MEKQTLTVYAEYAQLEYAKASDETKKTLESLFGKESLKQKSILERVKSLPNACDELGLDEWAELNGLDDYKKAEKAIEIFAKALREGKHESECFYYPFFDTSSGGFSSYVCVFGHVSSHVGARLRVDTAEKAKHLGKCMEPYYKTFLLGK